MNQLFFRNLIKNETDDTSNVSAPKKWFIDFLSGGETASGEYITEESAIRIAAVYSCVKILSQNIAKLPLQVYKKDNGRRDRAREHPVAYLLETRPNPYMTPYTFKQTMECHRQLWRKCLCRNCME